MSARNNRATKRWLEDMSKSMQSRIDVGDLDFDDYVYRTRDATDTLLAIWFGKKEDK